MAKLKLPDAATYLPPAEPGGPGLLTVVCRGKLDLYWLDPMPCDLDGRAWRLEKLDHSAAYHVRAAGPLDHDCDCAGHSWTDRCKHVRAVLDLVARGEL